MSTEIEQQIRTFLIANSRWHGPPSGLTADYPLIEKEVLDSMAIFETIGFLEDEFGIDVLDDDLVPENFETITSIANLVTAARAR